MSRSRWDPERLRAAMAVYLVAGPEQTGGDLLAACRAALANGATCLQLRAKELGGRDQLALALAMRELAHAHGALFVVNDRVDVAVAAKADGVHVGVSDLPLEATFTSRRGHELNLRWVYLHMIEEYARHNGHADLLRELVDGTTEA